MVVFFIISIISGIVISLSKYPRNSATSSSVTCISSTAKSCFKFAISNSNFSYRLIFPSQISLFLIHIYIIPQKQLITAKIYCFLLINVNDLFLIYLIFNPNNFDNSNA